MSTTIESARDSATKLLASMETQPGTSARLLRDPEETSRCFVFYWTVEPAATVPPGVGPIAVDRTTGEARFLGSQPLEIALDIAGLA